MRHSFQSLVAVFLCVNAAFFFACDALSFTSPDEDIDEEKKTETQPDPTLPTVPPKKEPEKQPGGPVEIYPPGIFTSAAVLYTDGTSDHNIKIAEEGRISVFDIPVDNAVKTIASITFYPKGTVVYIGRKADGSVKLEFNTAGTKLLFRSDEYGQIYKPILIGCYAELAKMRDMFDRSTWTGNTPPENINADFKQEEDIDLLGDILYPSNVYLTWKPIGDLTEETPLLFNGTYDGNGKKLINLRIESTKSDQGFFAGIGEQGNIKDLQIAYAFVQAADRSGILTATNSGLIENCIVSSSGISRTASAGSGKEFGGICGINKMYGQIIASYFTGWVSGINKLGGIAGVNRGGIKGCYHVGAIYVNEGGITTNAHHIYGSKECEDSDLFRNYWYNPSPNSGIRENSGSFGANRWPSYPAQDDPDEETAPWAEYRDRIGFGLSITGTGRWKTLGTPSDTPTSFPKLWYEPD